MTNKEIERYLLENCKMAMEELKKNCNSRNATELQLYEKTLVDCFHYQFVVGPLGTEVMKYGKLIYTSARSFFKQNKGGF